MKPRIKILLLAVLIAALCNCMLMIGMTKKKENNTIPKDASLICEETVSPNKDYITDEKDLVNYTVRVYQEKNNDIIVYAESNSPLFDEAQYIVTCDHAITAELMHKLVHAVDALALGKLLGMALKGTLASLDHLLARILAIMLHEGGNLLERGTRQLAGNLRCRNRARHIGHTRPSLHANQIKRRATRR